MIILKTNNVLPVNHASALYSSFYNDTLHLQIEINLFRINIEDLTVLAYDFDKQM